MASDEGERGARFEKTAIRAKRSLQELLEVAGGHPVVFDLQLVVGVARAIDVVRRTGENEVSRIGAHQPRDIGPTGGIADEEFVFSEKPKIRGSGDRRFRKLLDRVLIREPIRGFLRGEQSRQFFILEADEGNIEIFVLERASSTRSNSSSIRNSTRAGCPR